MPSASGYLIADSVAAAVQPLAFSRCTPTGVILVCGAQILQERIDEDYRVNLLLDNLPVLDTLLGYNLEVAPTAPTGTHLHLLACIMCRVWCCLCVIAVVALPIAAVVLGCCNSSCWVFLSIVAI
jgi:hypothetical protein